MRLVSFSVSPIDNHDKIKKVAECARICYASENKGNDSKDFELVKRLQHNKHLSMFRHITFYYIIPVKSINKECLFKFKNTPYVGYAKYKGNYYLACNGQFILEHQNLINQCIQPEWEVEEEKFQGNYITEKLIRYTFKINTQISTTRELNRVSPNNIAEQSTRYVDFNKKLGIQIATPHWFYGLTACKRMLAKLMFKTTEWNYKLAKKVLGLKPQDAREFLCLGTNSVVVYTYSLKEWRHILDLRYFGTTGIPHPNAYAVASAIKKIFKEHYDIDINEKGFESSRIK